MNVLRRYDWARDAAASNAGFLLVVLNLPLLENNGYLDGTKAWYFAGATVQYAVKTIDVGKECEQQKLPSQLLRGRDVCTSLSPSSLRSGPADTASPAHPWGIREEPG